MKIEAKNCSAQALRQLQRAEEMVWINPSRTPMQGLRLPFGKASIEDAEARLKRFAPFLAKKYPETQDGIVESALRRIPGMKAGLEALSGGKIPGQLFLKMDSHLPIAGSIKARGGIYEVLRYAEGLAISHGILSKNDNYAKLDSPECRAFFSNYTIQVGSTGNLGLSIGMISAALGLRAVVHMSSDAKQWKKDRLRQNGVTVFEYDGDYSEALRRCRQISNEAENCYFVDDENSADLFLGYAVAAKRLKNQLGRSNIKVDREHPLFVYLPCGVGGAPGGITFGLRTYFGDHVHCFFVEPTQAPCMAAGMMTGLHQQICVQDLGLSGKTHADGLAVGRPSGFVGSLVEPLVSGIMTIDDYRLYEYLRLLVEREEIFVEPSACAALLPPSLWAKEPALQAYLAQHDLCAYMENSCHIAWVTGGCMVPDEIQRQCINTFL